MYASPTTHAAALNAVIAMVERTTPTNTKELNYQPFGKAIESYAPVSDSRKRRAAAAERKAAEPTLPMWCKVILAIKAIIARLQHAGIHNLFVAFRSLGTMRASSLLAKIQIKMAHVNVQVAIQTTLKQLTVIALPAHATCDSRSKKAIKRESRALALAIELSNTGTHTADDNRNGHTGNYAPRFDSVAASGRETYFLGKEPIAAHARGM